MVALSAAQPEDLGAELCAEMAERRREGFERMRDRMHVGRLAGEISSEADLEALARFYVALHQGMSLQAREGASEATLQGLIDCAMAAWDPLTQP